MVFKLPFLFFMHTGSGTMEKTSLFDCIIKVPPHILSASFVIHCVGTV